MSGGIASQRQLWQLDCGERGGQEMENEIRATSLGVQTGLGRRGDGMERIAGFIP